MFGKKLDRFCKEYLDTFLNQLILVFKIFLTMHLMDLDLPTGVIALNIGLILILTSAAWLFTRRRIFLLAINLFCSLLLFSDILYYRYFKIPLTSYTFVQIPNLSGLGSSIFALLQGGDLLLFADFLFWPFLLFKCKTTHSRHLALLAMQLILGLILAVSYPAEQILAKKMEVFRRFDTAQELRKFGPLGFHLVDAAHYIKDRNIRLDKEKEQMILSWLEQNAKRNSQLPASAMEGIFQDRNLIIIQVESLQNFVINKTVGGQEITPHLNKLLKNSLYFPHFYPQTVEGNSSDAELIVNASVYPLITGSAFFSYPKNYYHSLPVLLKDRGYHTVAIHGDEASYWNRNAVYPHLGFDEFWDISKFPEEMQVGMGIDDLTMFEQSAQMLAGLPQPFYSFIVTLTSHYPYYLPADYQYLNLPDDLNGTHLGNYLQAIRFADEAIGRFIAKLQDNNLLENSFVVIYGDHDGLFLRDKEELERLFAKKAIDKNSWIREYIPVPLIIYEQGLSGRKYDTYGGQVDVLPTVACLLGLGQDAVKYSMGTNLLTAERGFAIIPRGDYIPETAFVTPEKIGEILSQRVKQTLEVADLIIRTDFFARKSKSNNSRFNIKQ